MATFIIMKTFSSPIAIVIPTPHMVVEAQRKKVNQLVDSLNQKASRNHYYAILMKGGIIYG